MGTFLLGMGLSAQAQQAADRELQELEARVKADSKDFIAWNRLGDLYLVRYREQGSGSWLTRAAGAAENSLKAVASEFNPAGIMLQARVDVAQHRFAGVRDRAQMWREMQPGKEGPLVIQIDALIEIGDLEAAGKLLSELRAVDGGSLTTQSRLARLAFMKGDLAEARACWDAAADAAAKAGWPPTTIAWCQVQLGELAFRRGEWTEAEVAYESALGAYPNWWSAQEHLAELRAAQGRDAEAVELFETVATATDRPEIWQSLGDLHTHFKRPEEAKKAYEKALAGYRASVDRGEILYVHHLAAFYSDSQQDPDEAVKWARKDLEGRQTPFAWDSLAWALYRKKDIPGALKEAEKVVASGIADSHVLYHAAMIYMSAGKIEEGQKLLRRCAEINPMFNSFHVHR